MRIILASASPRRQELLKELDLEFEIKAADIDESINTNNDLEEEIKKLAYRKAKHIYDSCPDALVIGADTIVTVDKQILGKPKDEEDAYHMLKTIQGRSHQVITGVALISKDKEDCFFSTSKVYMNEMDDEEIWNYIKTKEPLDKAGAYAIQGKAAKFISSIEGDYYAIMGLPIAEIYRRLKAYL